MTSSAPLISRLRLLVVPSVVALLSACITMPPQMRVENTGHPKHEDEDVRFRTTYYFRVFDTCADGSGVKTGGPRTDTLYRFRMTGKANSLSTSVRFESGTLTAAQIDPFGAAVVYDERNRQHYFKTQAESQQDAQRERRFDDLNRLVAAYGEMTKRPPVKSGEATSTPAATIVGDDPVLSKALRDVIKARIDSLADPQQTSATTLSNAAPTPATAACTSGRRGFQILGPEGWRTFNQDERLLLAMSTSGAPLISTLQEVSGRVLNNQPIEAELLLPLVREDLRISRAERELEKFDPTRPERGPDLLDAAIKALAAKEAAR